MELEDLVDRYKGSKIGTRLMLVFALSCLPAAYYWMEQGDSVSSELETAINDEASARARFNSAKRKISQLPQLLSRLSKIENQLKIARRVLPDRIEIDRVLGVLGRLASEHNIKIRRFIPGSLNQPNAGLEYKELNVDLEISGRFPQIMQFYDEIVHMSNLTHLRNVELDNSLQNDRTPNRPMVSRAQLILFKGK